MHRQLATTDEPVLSQVRVADFSDSDGGRDGDSARARDGR